MQLCDFASVGASCIVLAGYVDLSFLEGSEILSSAFLLSELGLGGWRGAQTLSDAYMIP